MDALSMNTLRIVLVGLTAIAAAVAAVMGLWQVALYLTVGIAAHGALWWWLHRQRTEEHDELHRGVEELLRSGDE
jgi:membrane protein implicated in regulation of membrane protease activity